VILPEGWAHAPLLDLVELHDNRRIPLNQAERAAMPGDFPYYGANGQVGTVGKFLFDGHYILLAEDGGFFDQPGRPVAYEANGQFWVNNHAHILSTKAGMPVSFFTRLLNTLDWMQFVSGTTRLKLTQGGMQQIKLPLPPIAEQRRIVAKLDTLTVRLIRARDELDRVMAMATELRNAAMVACLSPFADRTHHVPFEGKMRMLTSGSRDWAKYYDQGSSVFVLAGNVRQLAFDARPKRFVAPPLDSPDARRSRIKKDDLLITIVGAGTGDICSVTASYENYFVCQSVARIELIDPRLSKFYAFWFATPGYGRKDFEDAAYGAARPHLSFDQLKTFAVPNVDAATAGEVVSAVEAAFARADRMEAEAARARALLDRLEAAILARAFRGELVPQDPEDEPASVLLDRIRSERAAAPKARRGRRAAVSA
jgi:type I restriction enzyme, S subunit